MKPAMRWIQKTRFVFREVQSAKEMRDVLSLRYRVYSETAGLSALPSLDHKTRLDLDVFDLTSRHFALFAQSGVADRVVGTLRITGQQFGPMATPLRAIASVHPTLESRLANKRAVPLPMLTYLGQSHLVRAEYDRRVASGEEIAEPGRLTIAPELRVAAARAGVRLSHFFICCAEATAWYLLGLDRVFMDCDVALEAFYQRFGFFPVTGIRPLHNTQMGVRFTVLQGTFESITPQFRTEVERLAQQLFESKEAVLDPSEASAKAAHKEWLRAATPRLLSRAVTASTAA